MADLNGLLAKVLVAVEQVDQAKSTIDDLVNEIQRMVVTKAEADTITIDDPEG